MRAARLNHKVVLYTRYSNSPDAVEDSPVLEDPQQLVVRGDVVEVGSLLVGKEKVGLPYGVQHGRVQVEGGIRVFAIGEPGVIPLLPQEDVHSVILREMTSGFAYFCSAVIWGYERACV